MKRQTTNRLILIIVAVVILTAAGAAALLSRPVGNELYASIAMSPTQQTELGIAEDSSFTLTSDFRMKEDQLKSILQVEPHVDYTIDGRGKSWKITPQDPLEKNTVYTFRVLNNEKEVMQSFAFQTASDLMVTSSYPANESRYTDPNTAIELKFNASGVAVEDFFEILPPVAGTFEQSDYTTTFIPSAPLTENSVFRVKLKQGLTAPNGTSLKEDYTFSFETSSSKEQDEWDYTKLRTETYSETFLPGDPLVVELSTGSNVDGVEFDVKVHQFPDIASYSKELRSREEYYANRYGVRSDYEVKTGGFEEVVSYRGALYQKGDTRWGNYFAILPDDLPEGCYVVTVSGDDQDGHAQFAQKLIQIRNLAVYTQSVNGDTLIWVNDPATGGALSDLKLKLTDSKTEKTLEATTQEDGTARILTHEMQSAQLEIQRDGIPTYVEELNLSEEPEPELEKQFYTALYTDREVYRPNDTIHFWGTVKPRHMTNRIPSTVYAELSSWDCDFYKVKVDVNEDGTFTGELPYEGIKKSYCSLNITDGADGTYTHNGFEVEDYTKPPYFIDIKTSKDTYYYNEQVEIQVSASFYDGTPAAGENLNVVCYYLDFGANGEETRVTLDASGKAVVRATLNSANLYRRNRGVSWKPQSVEYSVYSAGPEDVQIEAREMFYALPSKIAAQAKVNGETKTLTVETAALNANRVSNNDWLPEQTEFDRLKGAPVDLPVSLIIHKQEMAQIPNGSYYDKVNKKTIHRHRTELQESVVQVLNGHTSGGIAVFENIPYESTAERFYWYEVKFSGGIVGHVTETVYTGLLYCNDDDNPNFLTFVDETKNSKDRSGPNYSGYQEPPIFALDEPIKLGLYEDNTKIENVGSMLCTAVQDKVISSTITRDDDLTLTMSQEFVPNVLFTGAYFDGRHIYKIENYEISYDYGKKLLDVKTTTDATRYQPGDTANISLTVTEKATGKPIAANVCVGVVDEAVFDIMPQELDIAEQIYEPVFYPNIVRSVSYTEYDLEKDEIMSGGMGGGGDLGGDIREEFVDTALFQTIAVDESGKAELELALPDNVTSWRITAAAVTNDLKAGNGVSNTIATLPFYLRPLYTDRYMEGDDVAISAGCVGTGITPQTTVSYTVTIFNAQQAQIDQLTADGAAGERTTVNFGKYEVGSYSMLIEGQSGDYHDAVKLPFSVINHAMTVSQIDNVPLNDVHTLTSMTYPVNVTVYDARTAAFMDGLHRLSGQSGSRTELMAAAYRAQVIYNNLLPEDEQSTIRKDARLDDIQTDDGGVKLLPLGEGDAALTAKLLIAAPQLISQEIAANFLQEVLADAASTPDDRVMAYVGLAAAKSPVLLDLTRMLKEDSTLSTAQKLYLGCGIAKLGDFTSAEQVYSDLKDAGVVKKETDLTYVTGATSEEQLQNTAAALMLTSITSNADADALMRYLNAQNNERSMSYTTLPNLEMLTYLEHFTVPYGEKTGKFSYTLDGETTDVVLDGKGIHTMAMNANDFQNVKFKNRKGDLFAAVNRTVSPDEAEVVPTNKLTITKQYTPQEDFQVGGKVRVDLTVTFSDDAPSGCYLVTDDIPSGMRYMPSEDSGPWYKWCWSKMEQDGQTMRGYVYRDSMAALDDDDGRLPQQAPPEQPIQRNVYTLTYFVSCMLPGEFVSESAYITPQEAGIAAKSERTTVTIKPQA